MSGLVDGRTSPHGSASLDGGVKSLDRFFALFATNDLVAAWSCDVAGAVGLSLEGWSGYRFNWINDL
jgi:hypothetical protein